MDSNTIYDNIVKGDYKGNRVEVPRVLPDGYVTDENQSVAWNREQVVKSREARNAAFQANQVAEAEARKMFTTDLEEYIAEELGPRVNKRQVEILAEKAYSDGHSAGYHGVLAEADELLTFITDFLNAK